MSSYLGNYISSLGQRSTPRKSSPILLVNGREQHLGAVDDGHGSVDIYGRRKPYIKKEYNVERVSDIADIKQWFSDNRYRMPRIILTIICTFIAAYQCWELTKEFLQYPTGVNVLVNEPANMREALPGITVCHKNR